MRKETINVAQTSAVAVIVILSISPNYGTKSHLPFNSVTTVYNILHIPSRCAESETISRTGGKNYQLLKEI